MLRATLAHLQPSSRAAPAATAAASPRTTTVEEQLAFPRGFSSHGPEADVDPAAARQMGLSAKEIAFFKEFGFIVSRPLCQPSTLPGCCRLIATPWSP